MTDEIKMLTDQRSAKEIVMPRGRLHWPVGTVTGRFSGSTEPRFKVYLSLKDNISPEIKRVRDQLRFYQLSAYYGERIAFLLTSSDRRQRKRGARLRDKRLSFCWWMSEAEARTKVQKFRESMEGAKMASFWDTELGMPYDTTRYRKD